jgi:phosphatidylglycerophosphatase C
MATGVAIFDFDRTLIRQSSLAVFLAVLVGRRRLFFAGAAGVGSAVFAAGSDRREAFRATVLRRTLAGKNAAQICAAAEEIFLRLEWNPEVLAAYERHRKAGHRILVATGGLSCYVRLLLERKKLTVDGLLASEMVVTENVLTGEMAGLSCRREEKARRIKAWLADAPGEIWGYGNLPNDAAMLALTHHPVVVSR